MLNGVNSDVNMQHVKECVQKPGNFYNDNNIHITPCLVQNAIDTLKSGKSSGSNVLNMHKYITVHFFTLVLSHMDI